MRGQPHQRHNNIPDNNNYKCNNNTPHSPFTPPLSRPLCCLRLCILIAFDLAAPAIYESKSELELELGAFRLLNLAYEYATDTKHTTERYVTFCLPNCLSACLTDWLTDWLCISSVLSLSAYIYFTYDAMWMGRPARIYYVTLLAQGLLSSSKWILVWYFFVSKVQLDHKIIRKQFKLSSMGIYRDFSRRFQRKDLRTEC